MFGIAPLAGERTYWFSVHASDLAEPIDAEAAFAQAAERFTRAAPAVRELLANGAADTVPTRLWTTLPMSRYVNGRYVVIGDAAHAMMPNLGRGACSAIVDAATLAAAMNRGQGLSRWEARRVPATQLARLGSGALMRLAVQRLA
ncbi:FAD-dependent monooxygenase [Demetria terragena]|uniref:FAD-dependent monooxygenase n=1 Tax=Demetria terragena TaxID=63959 RepID=UPI0003740A53|nr:FAD-dependent monooxygenase [Demetria terragena]